MYAESLGLSPLDDEIASTVAHDVEYHLRRLAQVLKGVELVFQVEMFVIKQL